MSDKLEPQYTDADLRANIRTHIPDFDMASEIMRRIDRADIKADAAGGVPDNLRFYGVASKALEALDNLEVHQGDDEGYLMEDLANWAEKYLPAIKKGLKKIAAAPTPPSMAGSIKKAFYDGWMRCGIYHVDIDFENDEQKAEVARRVADYIAEHTPPTAAADTNVASDALEALDRIWEKMPPVDAGCSDPEYVIPGHITSDEAAALDADYESIAAALKSQPQSLSSDAIPNGNGAGFNMGSVDDALEALQYVGHYVGVHLKSHDNPQDRKALESRFEILRAALKSRPQPTQPQCLGQNPHAVSQGHDCAAPDCPCAYQQSEAVEGLTDALNGNGSITYYAHRGRVEMDEATWEKVSKAARLQLARQQKGGA